MIALNLLPPEEKTEIVSHKTYRKVLAWGFSSLVLVLAFLAILSSIWLYLFVQLNSMQEIVQGLQASPQNQRFNDIKKEIDDVNRELKSFSSLIGQENEYSFYMDKLTGLLNSGIRFKSVSFDGSRVALSGQAATRESLLLFKDNLENSDYFQNVDAPLSNFLKQTDIDFSFSFEIENRQN
jgi:Tfp pilus assembly protein PilN